MYVSIGQYSSNAESIRSCVPRRCILGVPQGSILGPYSGVPQGSILGQYLFNIYINDIVNIGTAKFVIYADNSNLFLSSKNSDDLVTIANATLTKLGTWARDNILKLILIKLKLIFFGHKTSVLLKTRVSCLAQPRLTSLVILKPRS